MSDELILELYITGSSERLEGTIGRLKEVLDDELRGKYRIEIINVMENPQLADEEKIIATPTLVKKLPPPTRRIVGDLTRSDKVILGLGLASGS